MNFIKIGGNTKQINLSLNFLDQYTGKLIQNFKPKGLRKNENEVSSY